ncbi:hypothetical protein [Aquipuribacter nitratireducens]|uniref:SHOCT domain-containing protein n=1 Tax=Aquipuribacter nitratireducens TaxID=650104 RepID=A0ABW0GPD9_9MICO
MMWWNGWSPWWMGGGMLLGLVVLALVTWLLVATFRSPPRGRGGGPDARELLDRRLANGELSVEEWTRARDALDSRTP